MGLRSFKFRRDTLESVYWGYYSVIMDSRWQSKPIDTGWYKDYFSKSFLLSKDMYTYFTGIYGNAVYVDIPKDAKSAMCRKPGKKDATLFMEAKWGDEHADIQLEFSGDYKHFMTISITYSRKKKG